MGWLKEILAPGERIVLVSPPVASRRWLIGSVLGAYVVFLLFISLVFGLTALVGGRTLLFGVMFLGMLVLMMILTRWQAVITDRQLICRGQGLLATPRRMRLDEIDAVRHDVVASILTVRSADGRELDLRTSWTGIDVIEAALGREAEGIA